MIEFFLREKRLTIMISIVIIVAGLVSLKFTRREGFPSIDFGAAIVSSIYPGATPEDVEELVTQKIEDELRGIDGLKEVRSVSQDNLSTIVVSVDVDHANIKEVMDELQRAVDKVTDLPQDLEDRPVFQEIKTKNIPIIEISIHDGVDEHLLREYAKKLKDQLEAIDGVAKVQRFGYRDREYKIFLDPKKMETLHVGFDEVIGAIKGRNVDLPGGVFESRPHEMNIRTAGEIKNIDELKGIIVRTNLSGENILLGEIAVFEDSFKDPDLLMRANGEDSIMLVIYKREMADAIDVVENIRRVVSDYKDGLSEVNLGITESDDFAKYTSRRLEIIKSNAYIGFLLVLISLLLFLNWRIAIVTAISMPIIILATITSMVILGITINLISMLAIIIVLGMIVDNSIVVSDNISRYRDEGIAIDDAAIKGTKTIVWALCATIFTTIAAFAPLVLTKGLIGDFIKSIPVLVTLSLLTSLFESFYLLPARFVLVAKNQREIGYKWFLKLKEWFERQVAIFVDNRWKTIGIALALLISSILWAVFKMDFILFPPEGVDRLYVNYEAEVGTPIEELHNAVKDIERQILELPKTELKALITKTGAQERGHGDSLAKNKKNIGMLTLYLTDEVDRDRKTSQIIEDLRKKVKFNPPITKVQFFETSYGPPVGRPVTVAVVGEALDTLEKISNEVAEYLRGVKGVYDVESDNKDVPNQLTIRLLPNATKDYGLTTSDVALAVRAAHEGRIASTITEFEDEIQLRVLFCEKDRGNLTVLDKLMIADRRGNLIPLGEVAEVKKEAGFKDRHHLDFQRAVTVTADINTDLNTSLKVNKGIKKHFKDLSRRYPGYRLEFGGEDRDTKESMESLGLTFLIAIFFIFAILVALFNSFFKPFLVMLSIPFGLIGVVLGFTLQGKALGFLAMIGCIGLAGVVVNSSIVLIELIDLIYKEGGLTFREAVIKGTTVRLRPVLLTSITTVSALFPTAYGIGGWDPILVSITLALAWGITFGTVFTLVIVPSSYMALDDIRKFLYSKFPTISLQKHFK